MSALLSPLDRARLGQQEELTVHEIAALTFPAKEDARFRAWLTGEILGAIKDRVLPAHGRPDGWWIHWGQGTVHSDYPRCHTHQGSRPGEVPAGFKMESPPLWIGHRIKLPGDWCLLIRADYLAFLATRPDLPKPDWPIVNPSKSTSKTRRHDLEPRNNDIKTTAGQVRKEWSEKGRRLPKGTEAAEVIERMKLALSVDHVISIIYPES